MQIDDSLIDAHIFNTPSTKPENMINVTYVFILTILVSILINRYTVFKHVFGQLTDLFIPRILIYKQTVTATDNLDYKTS